MKKHKTGVLGPKGSYSQQAALQYNARAELVFFDTISEALEAVSSGKIRLAILPFENSIHGTILETLDGIYRAKLKILDEVVVNVKHVIAGLNKKIHSKDIKYIYSHPQALGQCKAYIIKHYPKAKTVIATSTSAAFKKIQDEGLVDTLAIGSELSAQIYGLTVIDRNVQDVNNNQTRFVIVSKKLSVRTREKSLPFTFFVINPKGDRPGLLYDILGVFKENSINLLQIESRPSREKLGAYIFYLKAGIKANDKRMITVTKGLKKFGLVTLLT